MTSAFKTIRRKLIAKRVKARKLREAWYRRAREREQEAPEDDDALRGDAELDALPDWMVA